MYAGVWRVELSKGLHVVSNVNRVVRSCIVLHRFEPLPRPIGPELTTTPAALHTALHESGIEMTLDVSETASTAHRHHAHSW